MCLPVERGVAHALDAVLLGVLQVVPDLGGEEHGLGGDAAPVRQVPPSFRFALDQRDLEPILPGADGAVYPAGPPPITTTS